MSGYQAPFPATFTELSRRNYLCTQYGKIRDDRGPPEFSRSAIANRSQFRNGFGWGILRRVKGTPPPPFMALPFIVERRRCGAKRRNGQPCRAFPRKGKLRCHVHGGAPGSGPNKSDRAHQLETMAKARETNWSVPHKNNGGPGGVVRAATAVRVNGKFAPNPDGPAKRKRADQIAVATVITMAKELAPVAEKSA